MCVCVCVTFLGLEVFGSLPAGWCGSSFVTVWKYWNMALSFCPFWLSFIASFGWLPNRLHQIKDISFCIFNIFKISNCVVWFQYIMWAWRVFHLLKLIVGNVVYSDPGLVLFLWGKVQKKALANRQAICCWDNVTALICWHLRRGTPWIYIKEEICITEMFLDIIIATKQGHTILFPWQYNKHTMFVKGNKSAHTFLMR